VLPEIAIFMVCVVDILENKEDKIQLYVCKKK
jgi:hypothetical protein